MSILIRPVISEKANIASEKYNRYTFMVSPAASKMQIKNAIQKAYGVEVENVRTLIVAPEVKTKHTKKGLQVGKTNKEKKAMVDLKEGQSIDVFGN